jgi:hypothetical protein
MNASTRLRTPDMSVAWTPSQAENAITPWSSWRCGTTSAIAAPRPIIAMMPLSWKWNAVVGSPATTATMSSAAHEPLLQRDRAQLRLDVAVGTGDPDNRGHAAPTRDGERCRPSGA